MVIQKFPPLAVIDPRLNQTMPAGPLASVCQKTATTSFYGISV